MAKRPRSVGARELKTRLGTYLQRVRAGETLIVTDRGEPIAELRPLGTATDAVEDAFQRMEAEGLLTRPTRHGPLKPHKPLKLPRGVSAAAAVRTERDESW